MLILFQITFTLIVFFVVIGMFRRSKKQQVGIRALGFWFFFWGCTVVLVWFPDMASIVASAVGIGRGVDMVLYSAIVLLFYIIFRLHIKIEMVNRDITSLVRTFALQQAKDKEDSRK